MNQAIDSKSRANSKPLYAQIAEHFAALIQSGDLLPGAKLPSQSSLMATYGVSQATVRQALLNLNNQGLVIARQGKGVFVAEQRIGVELGTNGTDGVRFDYEHLSNDLIAAPDRMAGLLEVEPGSHVIRARRRLLQLGRVVGLETFNLPFDIMQSMPANVLNNGDPRRFLAKSRWQAHHGTFRISAGPITDFDAEILSVATNCIVLQREDISSSQHGRPVMMTRSVFLADMVTLTGETGTGSVS